MKLRNIRQKKKRNETKIIKSKIDEKNYFQYEVCVYIVELSNILYFLALLLFSRFTRLWRFECQFRFMNILCTHNTFRSSLESFSQPLKFTFTQ